MRVQYDSLVRPNAENAEDPMPKTPMPKTMPNAEMPYQFRKCRYNAVTAGARFTVIRSNGNGYPQFWIAAFTRSLLSVTILSGRPTVDIVIRYLIMCIHLLFPFPKIQAISTTHLRPPCSSPPPSRSRRTCRKSGGRSGNGKFGMDVN